MAQQTDADDRLDCRNPSCTRRRRGADTDVDPHAAKFCSAACEVKFDHVKADARDRRADVEREREQSARGYRSQGP